MICDYSCIAAESKNRRFTCLFPETKYNCNLPYSPEVTDMSIGNKDISYVIGKEKFNYRVCGIMLHEGKILAMHDERSP